MTRIHGYIEISERMNRIIEAINNWRIEDGKGAVIDAWHRSKSVQRFPVWAWENRIGKPWQSEIERRVEIAGIVG